MGLIRVLYVDDEAALLDVCKRYLEKGDEFSVETVLSAEEALAILTKESFDVIVSDYQMPDMDGIAFLKQVRSRSDAIPFILFTGRGREEIVIQALNEGADFYLHKGGDVKSQFAELTHKIRQAVRRRQAEKRVGESEISYRGLFNTIRHALYILDREGKFVDVNTGAEKMYGYAREEFTGRTPEFLSAPGKNDLPAVAEKILNAFAGEPQEIRFWGLRKNGEEFPKDVYLNKGTYFGEDVVLAIGIDVSERTEAEATLRESENKFATVFKTNPVSLTLVSATDGRFVDVNDAFVANTGYSRQEVIGRISGELNIFADPHEYEHLVSQLQRTRHVEGMELQIRKKTGEVRICRFSSGIILMGGRPYILSTVEDINERKNAESAFETMTAGMVGTTGMGSLERITESISTWLGADCVMIGEIQPDRKRVKVLAMLLDGKKVEDYAYTLKGTPCENTAEKGFCLYPDNAAGLFPGSRDLRELNIQGYAGTSLRDAEGRTIGILCILTRKPLILPPDARKIFSILAVKAAAEIERKQSEDRLTRINEALLHLGTDHQENIDRLTRLCGELLNADCVLYNKLEGGMLCVAGQWNGPADLPARDAPEGHICYDVIRGDQEGPFVLSDLQKSLYAQTDPNVAAYGLKTYLGHPVRYGGVTRGTLCAVYTRDFIPTVEDERIIGILSSAVAQEEERREDQQALRESEERLRHFIRQAPVAFAMFDPNMYYLAASRRWVADFHLGDRDIIGHSHYEIFPEIPEKLKAIHRRALAGEIQSADEEKFERQDGSVQWLSWEARPWYSTGNSIGGIIIYSEDNTQRKKAGEELRESEAKFREIFNSADDGFHLHEMDENFAPGKYVDVNEVVCRMLQYSKEELLEKSPADISTPYHNPSEEEIGRNLRETGHTIFETGHRRKDGSIVPVEINAHVVTLGGKKLVLSIARDITGRKKAEDAIRQANRKLNLLSGITRHDIRNQILALQGYLEISQGTLGDPVMTAEFIEKEKKIAGTISSQISFAKIYEDLGAKAPIWQNISILVGRIVAGLPMRGIRIDCSDPGLEVFADPLFEKVFYNLIDNALRYGGETMTAIRIHSRMAGEDRVIIFEDNGAGIRAGDKARLFERGFGRNSGLGLFLSREILSITGMTIMESGEPGKGARFEMTVPAGQFRGVEP